MSLFFWQDDANSTSITPANARALQNLLSINNNWFNKANK
ncbi:hypothetical protein MuYL_0312 [Mucilaginibacter xinganensis]|uniref:Uncharacterized protein n=1 Tax=Mucilaginibacter xinganensis TaxID=1234841 RepID=A0A223NQM5_9SPHI|nr:hypothetical protein MuYL_0312 [Mucilaginibacter xinganensis]